MTFEESKKDFKESWHETKDAASAASDGVKHAAQDVGDELKEIADGEDK